MSQQEIFFYGHNPNKPYSYMSQWYPSMLVDIDGNEYYNCEQYMMASKASLFNDTSSFAKIMQTPDPKKVKALGRKVKNFDERVWNQHRERIVYEANFYKFSQNPILEKDLLSTDNAILIEASPYDRIWGIGFNAKDAPHNRDKWGLNLLGKALIKVREELKQT